MKYRFQYHFKKYLILISVMIIDNIIPILNTHGATLSKFRFMAQHNQTCTNELFKQTLLFGCLRYFKFEQKNIDTLFPIIIKSNNL